MNDIEKQIDDVLALWNVKHDCTSTGAYNKDGWKCDGWIFTINNQKFEYFTGIGHREKITGMRAYSYPDYTYVKSRPVAYKPKRPHVAGIIHSVLMEWSACEESFEDWCSSVGYDTDSRKALEAYLACQENFNKLRKVFTPDQISIIRECLQDY